MKKDEWMVWLRFNRMGHRFPSSLPPALLLVLAACSSGNGAGVNIGSPGTQDAGEQRQADARTDTARAPVDGNGSRDGAAVTAIADAGNMESDSLEGGSPATPDAGAPLACVKHGDVCSEMAGGVACCTDTCLDGRCGCLPEGAQVTDAGGTCCDNLPIVTGGYCGTNTCVPDGTPCGTVDAGVVCCNDDCNGTTCGGT